jgi:hypothetical protein
MAQNKTAQVEIEPYFRWDTYPQFINAINSVATYKLDIKGKSWGINAAYKISLKNNLLIKFGLGFFEYSFTNIESTHSSFGKGDERVIDYPTTLGIILGTDKYWYNTASINIGVEKLFELKNNLLITTRINLKNYFTFSQQYHIPADNSFIPPALKIENDYKTDINRYFGFGSEFQIGLLKKIGKINVGPSLIVPIYDTWKQDNIFPTEINSNNRNKWLRGFGFGIICNYSITKINNHAK